MKSTSDGLTATFVEFDPAALSDAAYRVLLHHGLGDKWLQIELALWHVMTEQVRNLDQVNRDSIPMPSNLRDLHNSLI